MKIKYNEATKSIKINDKQKISYYFTFFLLALFIINSIINGNHSIENQDNYLFGILNILVVIVFIIYFIYQILKKSISNNFNINEIDYVKEKKDWLTGQFLLSIKLKNGKTRDLSSADSEARLAEIKKLFDKIGISIK